MRQLNQLLNLPDIGAIKPGDKRWLGHVHGCAQALILKALVSCYHRLVVMIAKDNNQLHQLEEELVLFGVDYHVFPDWETLPYDQLSPNQSIISERLSVLTHMPKSGVLLVSAHTLAQCVAPPSWLLGQHFDLSVGSVFDIQSQTLRLSKAGYRAANVVYEPGEFAVRGSLIDIFPMGQDSPLRIELFDDEIESIRLFDVETQRSLEEDGVPKKLDAFRVVPAHEFPLVDGKQTFRNRFAETFPETSARKFSLHEDVMNGVAQQGLEYYLPLFFEKSQLEDAHLFAYLPDDALLVVDDHIDSSLTQFWQEVERRYHDLGADIERPIVPPPMLFRKPDQINALINHFRVLVCHESKTPQRQGSIELPFLPLPDVQVAHHRDKPLAQLATFIGDHPDLPVLLIAETPGRREILHDLLNTHLGKTAKQVSGFDEFFKSDHALAITVAAIDRALFWPNKCALISENQLFGHEVVHVRKRHAKTTQASDEYLIKSITELSVGDPVVHIDHGIGRYAGLVMLTLDDEPDEFVQIKYADDASIYLPVANLHALSRYSGGDPANAPLHRIGSEQWSKAKAKALEKIHDVAAELLDVQARRDAKPGIGFKVDASAYDLFASQFAFEETTDQAQAIDAVLHDMKQNKPMDRLICGDVGFGKTEVAMRAAFVATQSDFQVAVLVPTTLLAEQHEDSFKSRFADWPIRVEGISRFGGKAKTQNILADVRAGKVDILIGTHKLLQDDVAFANLGLMIVDEEHRFGVRHKEKIKSLRSDVDMLTLTATPIPRTLNMSLSGMRDLSIIASPPSRRLAIKTFVLPKTDALLKEAILRELLRGGQVYYLHNDIASIERVAENIRELLPEARVGVAHVQMRGRQLEKVMEDFYHKRFNVLVCTTIIETGIDIANANTIIIERADKFGLAQLHQLRGRVGRSHHQAYAYMLVPSLKGLKPDAKKRLKAIQRANTLGAGFMLASEDLEIRGAGELLGQEQSGNMQAVGFSLYMDMLERATKAIKDGTYQPDTRDNKLDLQTPLSLTSDINLHCSALIADDYLPDVHQRLLLYKRISGAKDEAGLSRIRVEMIDRFGALPEPTQRLFEIHKIRLIADKLGITKIDANSTGARISFLPSTPVEAMTIIKLIQSDAKRYRMDGVHSLRITDPDKFDTSSKRIDTIHAFLKQLAA